MKDFTQFMELFHQELNEFKDIDSHKKLEDFNEFLGNYIQVAEITYPLELHNLLMSANQFPLVISQIPDLIKPITEVYKVDISPKGIKLTKGDKDKIFPLMDIKSFILNYFHDKEDTLFYLILASIIQTDCFYNIQVFSVIMQMKLKITE